MRIDVAEWGRKADRAEAWRGKHLEDPWRRGALLAVLGTSEGQVEDARRALCTPGARFVDGWTTVSQDGTEAPISVDDCPPGPADNLVRSIRLELQVEDAQGWMRHWTFHPRACLGPDDGAWRMCAYPIVTEAAVEADVVPVAQGLYVGWEGERGLEGIEATLVYACSELLEEHLEMEADIRLTCAALRSLAPGDALRVVREDASNVKVSREGR